MQMTLSSFAIPVCVSYQSWMDICLQLQVLFSIWRHTVCKLCWRHCLVGRHDRRWRQCRLLFTSGTTMLQAPLPFSPVETSDHTISFYISDGFFSHVALCCNGTSTHENTHGKLFEDISHSLLSFLFFYISFFYFCHFPITELLGNLLEVSTVHAKVVYFNNIWRYANENVFLTHLIIFFT